MTVIIFNLNPIKMKIHHLFFDLSAGTSAGQNHSDAWSRLWLCCFKICPFQFKKRF